MTIISLNDQGLNIMGFMDLNMTKVKRSLLLHTYLYDDILFVYFRYWNQIRGLLLLATARTKHLRLLPNHRFWPL